MNRSDNIGTGYAVVTVKASGALVVVSRHAAKREAESQAAAWRRTVGPAEVRRVSGAPGTTVQRS